MNIQIYIAIGIAFIILLLLIWAIRLEIKLYKLLGKRDGALDDAIHSLRKDTDALKKYAEDNTKKIEIIDKKLKKTISGNETVRFNPFKGNGSGSNQSFATALLNSEGDGVVISSLYSRDHISVFSKPIKNMNSEYELTEEEKIAIQKSKESIV